MNTSIDKDTLVAAVKSSRSVSEVCRILGRSYYSVDKYIGLYSIDKPHFLGKDGTVNLLGKKFGRLTVIAPAPKKGKSTAWKCLCECGKEVDVRTGALNGKHSKTTKSCGCLKTENLHHMFAANIKHTASHASAIMVWRGHYNDADLSLEEFKILSQLNCFYCDLPPSNVANSCKSDPRASSQRQKEADYVYSGLDRFDSSKRHCRGNVVPSCFPCNFAKCDLHLLDFRDHISKVINYRFSNYDGSFVGIKTPTVLLIPNPILIPKEKAQEVSQITIGDILGKLTVIGEADHIIGTHKKLICRCECGAIKNIAKVALLSGRSRSCNGGRCRGQYCPYITAARNAWHTRYHLDGLSFEAFFELSQMNCTYCNSLPVNSMGSQRSNLLEDRFVYNGLDRIDSTFGHSPNNVIPCCITCNTMKSNRSLLVFDNWITKLNNHFLPKFNKGSKY